MPNIDNTCMYALYVVGEVESNWYWTAISDYDPISIGIVQWYGTRAAALLKRLETDNPTAYNNLSTSLKDTLNLHNENDRFWNTFYLNQEQSDSIVTAFSSKESHAVQEAQAIEDFKSYAQTLTSWGMNENNPREIVFAMSMYHQSPAACGRVISSAGGSATLDYLYESCLNNTTLGKFKSRYNKVYQRLKSWNGETPPPDFGQTGIVDDNAGGDNPTIVQDKKQARYIVKSGDTLFLYGSGAYKNGVAFTRSTINTWVSTYNPQGTPITPDNSGGGTDVGTDAAIKVVNLMKSWEGQFNYNRTGGGRLSPETSGYTDCSGCVWAAYHKITGLDVGQSTAEMITKGTVIAKGSGATLPFNKMKPADIIIIWWKNGQRHAELYCGGTEIIGQRGPGNGPTVSNNGNNFVANAANWEIRRHL